MKILITGATGQLGRAFVSELLKDQRFDSATLKLLVRNGNGHHSELNRENIEIFQGDLSVMTESDFKAALEGIDIVVHLAAIFNMFQKYDDVMRKTNVEATEKLLQCFTRTRAKLFIHISSIVVYGFNGSSIKTETSPLSATYGYGRSKQESDQIAMKFQQMVEQENSGQSIVILRPAAMISREDKIVLPMIEKFVLSRIKLRPPLVFPLVHVKDVVNVLKSLILNNHCKNQVYNVCSYQPDINRLSDILVSGFPQRGYKKAIFTIPVSVIKCMKPLIKIYYKIKHPGPDSIIPPLFLDAIGSIDSEYRISTEKIEKELEYSPFFSNCREAISNCLI
ncbi:MAG: NAD-dependent epimerase/dehydratase family protein [Candidatus Hodarchaeales archaeon]